MVYGGPMVKMKFDSQIGPYSTKAHSQFYRLIVSTMAESL